MKAIVVHEWGGPEVMGLEEVPDPAPGPDEVVVKIERAGVNPVETYIRSGIYPVLPELPFVPGLDAAGVVEAVGADVANLAANLAMGQRVYVACGAVRRATGCYAERIAVSARAVFGWPDGTSVAQGAAIGTPYATAYRGLFQRGGARPG
ncbi:MAG: alcohol dehydrogenase catalytic domain-containing protein, partial [Alphaproteobacteria bacterium]